MCRNLAPPSRNNATGRSNGMQRLLAPPCPRQSSPSTQSQARSTTESTQYLLCKILPQACRRAGRLEALLNRNPVFDRCSWDPRTTARINLCTNPISSWSGRRSLLTDGGLSFPRLRCVRGGRAPARVACLVPGTGSVRLITAEMLTASGRSRSNHARATIPRPVLLSRDGMLDAAPIAPTGGQIISVAPAI